MVSDNSEGSLTKLSALFVEPALDLPSLDLDLDLTPILDPDLALLLCSGSVVDAIAGSGLVFFVDLFLLDFLGFLSSFGSGGCCCLSFLRLRLLSSAGRAIVARRTSARILDGILAFGGLLGCGLGGGLGGGDVEGLEETGIALLAADVSEM